MLGVGHAAAEDDQFARDPLGRDVAALRRRVAAVTHGDPGAVVSKKRMRLLDDDTRTRRISLEREERRTSCC